MLSYVFGTRVHLAISILVMESDCNMFLQVICGLCVLGEQLIVWY